MRDVLDALLPWLALVMLVTGVGLITTAKRNR